MRAARTNRKRLVMTRLRSFVRSSSVIWTTLGFTESVRQLPFRFRSAPDTLFRLIFTHQASPAPTLPCYLQNGDREKKRHYQSGAPMLRPGSMGLEARRPPRASTIYSKFLLERYRTQSPAYSELPIP